jgi:hypothetical protein
MVQVTAKSGFETIMGVTQDKLFEPMIVCGSGGIYSELVDDVSSRLHPLTDLNAQELISSIIISTIFDGFRGRHQATRSRL